MAQTITSKDFIVSGKKNSGDVFEIDWNNISDNQKNHQAKGIKGNYDATWGGLLFKLETENGTRLVPIKKFVFENVIISSKPTMPSKDDKDNKVKNMLVALRKMTEAEIRTGDYLPKTKDSPEEQTAENKRADDFVNIVYKNTNEFIDALEVIATGFNLVAEKLCALYMESPDKFTFNMVKERNWIIRGKSGERDTFNPPIRSIRQTHRKDEKNPHRPIALENPIFRLKLPVHDNKMLMSWRNKSGMQETADYIFDARKTIINKRSGQLTLVPAKIKSATNAGLKSLDVNNVDEFITYKSIISGYLEFPKFVISKQGISLVNQFKQLVVRRYKAKAQVDTGISNNTLVLMKGQSDEEDDDVMETLPELSVNAQKSSSGSEDEKHDSAASSENSEDDSEITPKARISRADLDNKVNKPKVEISEPPKKSVGPKKLTKVAPPKKQVPKYSDSDDEDDLEV